MTNIIQFPTTYITSATRGEVRARAAVERVMGARQATGEGLIKSFERLEKRGWVWCGGVTWLECKVSHREHTEGYMVGIAQAIDIQHRRDMRGVDPIFLTDDNGGAS